MKKYMFFLIGIVFLAATAFTVAKTFEPTNATATVNQVQGVYIFSDSKPVMEYTYLGTVKTSNAAGFVKEDYGSNRDRLLKNLKKDYPDADGLILSVGESGAKADAIKFK